MAKAKEAAEANGKEPEEEKVEVVSLDEAIKKRIAANKRKAANAEKDAEADAPEKEKRLKAAAKALSDHIAKLEGVDVPAKDWVIEEEHRAGDQNYYKFMLDVPPDEEEAKEGEAQMELAPLQTAVWVKSVTLNSLKGTTFPYRWTARDKSGMIKKTDDFLDAVTFAKTGL